MYKTNSKEVKKAIRDYLTENVLLELEEREIETDHPFHEYFSIIESEKYYINYSSDYLMFKDWLQGLGGFGADIYYRSSKKGFSGGLVQDILQSWLNQTDAEVLKYSGSQSEELMCNLCYREFLYLLKKEEGK